MALSSENLRSPRMVEIFNSDGTVTTYSSMYSAGKSIRLKRGRTAGVYVYVARGGGRIVDIRIPVEVVNEDGTRSTYQDINEVARIYGISTMEVHNMISNGTARLGKPTRKVLTKPITRRKGLRTKCAVEVLNENGTTDRTFGSIKEAGKVLGNNNMKIYAMVARGKARLVYRENRRKEEKYREEEEEEEKSYDAVEYQKEEERFYDAVKCQEKGMKWESWLKPPNSLGPV